MVNIVSGIHGAIGPGLAPKTRAGPPHRYTAPKTPPAGGDVRDHLAAQAAEERSGLGRLRRGGGIDDDDRRVPGGVDDRRVSRGPGRSLATPGAQPREPG